jgi:hypothetical protein
MTFKERTILAQKILSEQPLITFEMAKKQIIARRLRAIQKKTKKTLSK